MWSVIGKPSLWAGIKIHLYMIIWWRFCPQKWRERKQKYKVSGLYLEED